MGTVSLTLPSDGQTIDASDVNNPLNTLAAEINGQLDNSNIKTGAAIDRSKIAGFTDGWESLGYAPTTITALGNRSYTVVIPSVDTTTATSPGQRLKLPRTVTAPTQCTSLNGTTQYFSKSSPSGLSFTTTFTCSAWIKPTSYQDGVIIGRWNGTSGWGMKLVSSGQLRIQGLGPGVNRTYDTYQSVPLNKWTHVAFSLDMSGTAVAYIDGVVVPTTAASAVGSALTQAGNLEVGSWNGGTSPFAGKIAQPAVYSAIISAATIRASMNQTLTGSETSLISAYSFNGVITDLASTGNNLTASGSAVATNPDTPFTNPVTGTSVTAGTTNYGIIMAQTFSTNTTYTIQIPEGETLPTTGGIGTVSYSTQKTPYGWIAPKAKWDIECWNKANNTSPTNSTYNHNLTLTVPVGEWDLGYEYTWYTSNSSTNPDARLCISTSSSSVSNPEYVSHCGFSINNASLRMTSCRNNSVSLSSATPYYTVTISSNANTLQSIDGSLYAGVVRARNLYV